MMRADYYGDGYTADGYIAAVKGLHGELRFKYRPFLVEECLVLEAATKNMDAAASYRCYVEAVKKRLVEWSLTDSNGIPVEISVLAIVRMADGLWWRMRNIMVGVSPTDDDPAAGESEKQQRSADMLAAAIAGTTIGQITEVTAEKNSATG